MEAQQITQTKERPTPKTPKKGKRISKKKRIVWGVTMIVAATAVAYFLIPKTSATVAEAATTATVTRGSLTFSTTVSGTTAYTSRSQTIASALPMDVSLTVKSVLKASGDTVAAGDNLYELNSEGVEALRVYFEKQASETKIAAEAAQVQYESDLLDAQYTYNTNTYLKTTAKKEYDEAISELDKAISEAKTKLTEANQAISDNPSLILAAKTSLAQKESELAAANAALGAKETAAATTKTAYEQAEETYLEAKTQYEGAKIAKESLEQFIADNSLDSDSNFSNYLAQLSGAITTKNDAYTSAKKTWEEKKSAYESAQAALADCQTQITALESQTNALSRQISELEQALSEANRNQASLAAAYQEAQSAKTTQSITAKAEYEEALITCAAADDIFEKTKLEIEQTLADAQAASSTASEALAAFEAEMGDGYLHAAYDGVLSKLNFSAESRLMSVMPYVTYQDTGALTLVVSVDQAYVSSISVGTEVAVLTQSGRVTGTISTVGTTSSSSSVSNVTYDVTIALDTSVGSGVTGRVSFNRATYENVLYLPSNAIYENTSGKYVKLVDAGGTVSEVAVETGDTDGSNTILSGGLEEGAVCITKA